MTLLLIIAASALSGLIALLAALTLLRGKLWSHERSHLFLSFAAGTLLSVAFLDLLPEAFEALAEARGGDVVETASMFVLLGFLLFFTIEKLILWYHCHEEKCDVHTSVPMVLLGDTLHNFLDGVAIAASFLVSVPVGMATTLAVFIHEIPQEVADFSVLLGSGMKPRRALGFNILSSLASLLGAVVTYVWVSAVEGVLPVLLALTAGGFIYISSADLIPEIHKETRRGRMIQQLVVFLIGFALVVAVTRLGGH